MRHLENLMNQEFGGRNLKPLYFLSFKSIESTTCVPKGTMNVKLNCLSLGGRG